MNLKDIPQGIKKAFEDYGHSYTLDQVVAMRRAPERGWFGLLFSVDGELSAVDFQRGADGEWEVSNDYIGPFDSIKEFEEEKLVSSWF